MWNWSHFARKVIAARLGDSRGRGAWGSCFLVSILSCLSCHLLVLPNNSSSWPKCLDTPLQTQKWELHKGNYFPRGDTLKSPLLEHSLCSPTLESSLAWFLSFSTSSKLSTHTSSSGGMFSFLWSSVSLTRPSLSPQFLYLHKVQYSYNKSLILIMFTVALFSHWNTW